MSDPKPRFTPRVQVEFTSTQRPIPPPPEPSPESNDPGKNVSIASLVTAILGFLLVVTPGAVFVGGVLLLGSFVLSVIGLLLSRQKALALGAFIVTIVGAITGIIAFTAFTVSAIDSALSPTVIEQVEQVEQVDTLEVGSFENPVPRGAVLTDEDWVLQLKNVSTRNHNGSQETHFTWYLAYTGKDPVEFPPNIKMGYLDLEKPEEVYYKGSIDIYETQTPSGFPETTEPMSMLRMDLTRDTLPNGIWKVQLPNGGVWFFSPTN